MITSRMQSIECEMAASYAVVSAAEKVGQVWRSTTSRMEGRSTPGGM
uniref:Uncharacterized protein n=1 Tax=Siphoviridae sp. ctx254 TaxID=2825737 RepID=A0A8S5TVL7_9CAUD|nr:MAG TPA: hypothetical protein [Siphoviridae sp. ctx254]